MMGIRRSRLTTTTATTTRPTTTTTTTTTGGGGGFQVFLCLSSSPCNDVLRVRQVTVVVDIIVFHHRVHDLCQNKTQPEKN